MRRLLLIVLTLTLAACGRDVSEPEPRSPDDPAAEGPAGDDSPEAAGETSEQGDEPDEADPDEASDPAHDDSGTPVRCRVVPPAGEADATAAPVPQVDADAGQIEIPSENTDAGPIDPTPDATEVPIAPISPDEVPPECNACIGRCNDVPGCQTRCAAMVDALDPVHLETWATCFAVDPNDPDRPRLCMEVLDCGADAMVRAHCDVLARCASDGRGWLDEESCRARPYAEPRQWACLQPDRRDAVTACMESMMCSDLEPCLRAAVCGAGSDCPAFLNTRLAVDCYRICERGHWCDGQDFAGCYDRCDHAALRLADEHRRSFETCALDNALCPGDCVADLACDLERLAPAITAVEARCGPRLQVTAGREAYACLGEVLQSGIATCLESAECGELVACVDRATCGDASGCLAFLDRRGE